MLVISRKPREWILAIDRQTQTLFAKIVVVKNSRAEAGLNRIGVEFPEHIFVVRQELTELSCLSFDDMANVPIGTQVRVNGREQKPA
jgi:sRNA-binding carbon storage regulator CsrA